jgi:hypothetical protein
MGMEEEGMQRGRDLGYYQEGRAEGDEQGRSRADDIMERMFYDERGSPIPIPHTPMQYSLLAAASARAPG